MQTRRLDLDSAKGKALKNAQNAAMQEEMQKTEKAFHEQQNAVREMFKNRVEPQICELQKHLKALVQGHLEHAKKCSQLLEEFNKKL